MTDQVDDVERARLARIATLSARRTTPQGQPTAARRRRRHPAQLSRIVAASIGASTMCGIVTMLGVTNATANQPNTAVAAVDVTPTVAATKATPATAPIPAVIELSAGPVVRVVAPAPPSIASAAPTPQPAPVATTRGSS